MDSKTLDTIKRVGDSGKSEVQPRQVCIPLRNDSGKFAGAIFLELYPHGEKLGQRELQFCNRCARWLELARLGRASPDMPSLYDGEEREADTVAKPKRKAEPRNKKSLTLEQPVVFFRSLATLVGAGIPIHSGLHHIGEAEGSPNTTQIANELATSIGSGRRLSVAMAEYPEAFQEYFVSLIRVGETSGALVRVLRIISDHLEKSQKLTQTIKSTLTYPLILVAGALLMLLIAPSWLLDGHLKMLQNSGVELPPLTQLLILWSNLCQSPAFVASLGLLAVGLFQALKHPKSKRMILNWLSTSPGLGPILKLSTSARFARALSIALKAGVNILQAIPLSAEATGDEQLIESLQDAKTQLEDGSTISQCLYSIGYFPPGFTQLVDVGEQTAKLDRLLGLSADLYEMELDLALTQLTVLLEPLLLMFIGIFTGLILVATMQPTIALLEVL